MPINVGNLESAAKDRERKIVVLIIIKSSETSFPELLSIIISTTAVCLSNTPVRMPENENNQSIGLMELPPPLLIISSADH